MPTLAPNIETWKKNFDTAKDRLATTVAGIWEKVMKEKIPGLVGVVSGEARRLKAALMEKTVPIQKAFQEIWKAFGNTCSNIKQKLSNLMPDVIKTACDMLFKKVTVAAEKTAAFIVKMSKETGIKVTEAAKFVTSVPGKALGAMEQAGRAAKAAVKQVAQRAGYGR